MLLTCAALMMLAQASPAQTLTLQTAKPTFSQANKTTHFRQGDPGRLANKPVVTALRSKPGMTVKEAPTALTSNLLTLSDPKLGMDDNGINGMNPGDRCYYASIFSADLMKRFAGNTMGTFQTILPQGITSAQLMIIDANTMQTLWSTTLSSPQTGTVISVPCDYQITGDAILMCSTFIMGSGLQTLPFYMTPTYQSSGLLIAGPDGAFMDFSSQVYDGGMYGCLYFNALTEGGAGLKDYDAQMMAISNQRSTTNADLTMSGSVTMWGMQPVMSVDITTTIGETSGTASISTGVTEETAAQQSTYGAAMNYSIEGMKAPATPSRYTIAQSIAAVNGNPDGYAEGNDNVATTVGIALGDQHYDRKAVVEEMTGLWCGWCPRGMVAMENLKTMYADDVITIAVHADDALQSESYLPMAYMTSGFPSAFINRFYLADPYYGFTADATMGITDVVDEILASPAEAQIGVTSKLSADGSTIDVTSYTRFCLTDNSETPHYAVAYALVEDGVRGLAYAQTNYYSSQMSGGPYSGRTPETSGLPDDLAQFVGMGPSIQGLTYNDVARGIYDCFGVEGSLNSNIQSGSMQTHTYSIPVPESISNIANTTLVAMVVDTETMEVINAVEVKVGESNTTGIEAVKEPAKADISVSGNAITVTTDAGGSAVAKVYSTDGKLVAQATVNGSATLAVDGQKGTYIVRVENGNDVTVKKVML